MHFVLKASSSVPKKANTAGGIFDTDYLQGDAPICQLKTEICANVGVEIICMEARRVETFVFVMFICI